MSHLPFTILAYFFNALSVLASKFLLKKVVPNPLLYIFYISALSLILLFAIPFIKLPTLQTFILASLSTIFWTTGAYLMFKALKLGSVSRVIPIIGTLIPIILLIEAAATSSITSSQIMAVLILLSGMVFLTITDWKNNINKKEIIFEILSAIFFALSYIILRQAYLQADFLSVLVWSRPILIPFCIFFLLSRKISKPSTKMGLLFAGGQVSGVISELLILFSISLATPALVNSLQGTQYVFLLIFSLILARKFPEIYKENYTFLAILTKISGIASIALGLFLLSR